MVKELSDIKNNFEFSMKKDEFNFKFRFVNARLSDFLIEREDTLQKVSVHLLYGEDGLISCVKAGEHNINFIRSSDIISGFYPHREKTNKENYYRLFRNNQNCYENYNHQIDEREGVWAHEELDDNAFRRYYFEKNRWSSKSYSTDDLLPAVVTQPDLLKALMNITDLVVKSFDEGLKQYGFQDIQLCDIDIDLTKFREWFETERKAFEIKKKMKKEDAVLVTIGDLARAGRGTLLSKIEEVKGEISKNRSEEYKC